MKSSIGIKLADGSFYPIMDNEPLSEKSLELTTMRDDQESVQINLFKREENSTVDPEYIGSLIVEDITKGIAGDPTIDLNIKLDEEENLSAEVLDIGSGAKQTLKVPLRKLAEDSFDIPDFDISSDSGISLGDDPDGEDVLIPEMDTDYSTDLSKIENNEDESNADLESFDEIELQSKNNLDEEIETQTEYEETEEKKKGFPLWAIILLILLCIGALVIAIFLLMKKPAKSDKDKIATANNTTKVEKVDKSKDVSKTTTTPPKEDANEKAQAEAKKKAEEEAKQKAEEEQKQKEAEAAKKKAEEEQQQKAEEEAARKKEQTPKIDEKGVVKYKVKWGDTLWDLSESFYKTPWLYSKIARHNKIKDPNLIISGTYIEIPPK